MRPFKGSYNRFFVAALEQALGRKHADESRRPVTRISIYVPLLCSINFAYLLNVLKQPIKM